MIVKKYFETENKAWTYAINLPKGVCLITDYGKDEEKADTPYYIEYEIKKRIV